MAAELAMLLGAVVLFGGLWLSRAAERSKGNPR